MAQWYKCTEAPNAKLRHLAAAHVVIVVCVCRSRRNLLIGIYCYNNDYCIPPGHFYPWLSSLLSTLYFDGGSGNETMFKLVFSCYLCNFSSKSLSSEARDQSSIETNSTVSSYTIQYICYSIGILHWPNMYMQGHCLLIGFRVTWIGILLSLVSAMKKMLGKRKQQRPKEVCCWEEVLGLGG